MLLQNLLLLVAVNGNISVMYLVQNRISSIIPGRKYRVLCIWPFLFISYSELLPRHPDVFNHERIHAGSSFRAYQALSHEQEAFRYECDANYLKRRRWFTWLSFI